MHKLDTRPPVHNFDRPGVVDCQVAYIGEGLVDPNGLPVGDLDHLGDIDEDLTSKQHRRKLLDSLAIDVGEKYLDDIYKREDGSDGDVGDFTRDEPEPEQRQSILYSPAVAGEPKVRTGKERAWLKVRRLLIEEEEKAATRKKSVDKPGEVVVDCYGTVRLLDSMARSGNDDGNYNNLEKVDSSLPPTPVSTKTLSDLPQTLANGIDRMGNRLALFLNRGQISDDESSGSARSRSGHLASPYPEKALSQPLAPGRAQLELLAMLGQVTRTCQRMELSEASMARISSHLALIDQIAREDIGNPQKRGPRRLSSTQWSNDSSEYDIDFRYPMYPMRTIHARVSPTVRNSFKAFTSALDLMDTVAAFNNLLAGCGLAGAKMEEPWHVYYHIRAAVYSKLGFRQKQLFKLLDLRFELDVYKRRPAANKRVCIVGAGPVGLRAAVELALLGCHVSVLEKRTKFSRENMLHLWPWVVQDLASLGAKVLFRHFCRSRTYFHVSTRQLQVILLKVALLVGVQVHTSTDFEAIVPPSTDNESGGRPFYSIKTEPQIPVTEVTAVLGATGVNDQLAEPAGINRFVFNCKESLGIVCYFPNLETSEEMKVKEFSWTAQLKHQMLNKMRDTGIDLENIVYFRGEMHYLVMTPRRQNLLTRGVVRMNHPSSADLVKQENISQSALHAFVNSIVKFAGIPRKTEFSRVSLFDFSSLTRADKAASILTSGGKKLCIGLVGDSLLEPVWHEGVGTCRGFLSALDAVWMVAQIGKKADEQILADRELAYKVMQRLSGHHRDEMQKNVRKYTVDPRSRYVVDFPRVV